MNCSPVQTLMHTRTLLAVAVLAATPSSFAGDAERSEVSFRAADGMQVFADFHAAPSSTPGPAPTAILLHDRGGERGMWAPLVTPLRRAGFNVLAIDLRGHGRSASTETRAALERGDRAAFVDLQQDLRGAYDWLAQQPRVDRTRLALGGAGMGAAAALRYAAADCSIDVVVLIAPTLDVPGLDAAGDAAQIRGRRILAIGGAGERDALNALRSRNASIDMRVIDSASKIGAEIEGPPSLVGDVVRFASEHIGAASARPVCGTINSDIYHATDSDWVRKISATNLRYYSSAEEAEARGLRAARSRGPRGSAPPMNRP